MEGGGGRENVSKALLGTIQTINKQISNNIRGDKVFVFPPAALLSR